MNSRSMTDHDRLLLYFYIKANSVTFCRDIDNISTSVICSQTTVAVLLHLDHSSLHVRDRSKAM